MFEKPADGCRRPLNVPGPRSLSTQMHSTLRRTGKGRFVSHSQSSACPSQFTRASTTRAIPPSLTSHVTLARRKTTKPQVAKSLGCREASGKESRKPPLCTPPPPPRPFHVLLNTPLASCAHRTPFRRPFATCRSLWPSLPTPQPPLSLPPRSHSSLVRFATRAATAAPRHAAHTLRVLGERAPSRARPAPER